MSGRQPATRKKTTAHAGRVTTLPITVNSKHDVEESGEVRAPEIGDDFEVITGGEKTGGEKTGSESEQKKDNTAVINMDEDADSKKDGDGEDTHDGGESGSAGNPGGTEETGEKTDDTDSEENADGEDENQDTGEDSGEDDDSDGESKDTVKRFTSEQMNAIIARKTKDLVDKISQLETQLSDSEKMIEDAKKEGMAAGKVEQLREQTAKKYGIKKSLIPTTEEDIEEFNKQLDKFTTNNMRVIPAQTKLEKEKDDDMIAGVISGGSYVN